MTGISVRPALPANVEQELATLLSAARTALGSELHSVVLFGSAAEGRLRATSDVNLILVLHVFNPAKFDQIRDPMRVARAAIRLAPMLLLLEEIEAAVEAFSVKFADILRRRVVLHGEDPFRDVTVSRDAAIRRLGQVLLNLAMRLRQAYVLRSLREEQLALTVADAGGPLRASAATILELEGTPAESPKQALEIFARRLPGGGPTDALAQLSIAREKRELPSGVAGDVLLALIELANQLRLRADGLK